MLGNSSDVKATEFTAWDVFIHKGEEGGGTKTAEECNAQTGEERLKIASQMMRQSCKSHKTFLKASEPKGQLGKTLVQVALHFFFFHFASRKLNSICQSTAPKTVENGG